VLLAVGCSGWEHHDVHPLARRPNLDRELRLAVLGLELVLAYECLLEVLSDVLLRSVADMPAAEEVRNPALGNRAGRNRDRGRQVHLPLHAPTFGLGPWQA
jgi:hypothetical protein